MFQHDNVFVNKARSMKTRIGVRALCRPLKFLLEPRFGVDEPKYTHTEPDVFTWFAKVGVEEPEWPAQSPDLNPTEHL